MIANDIAVMILIYIGSVTAKWINAILFKSMMIMLMLPCPGHPGNGRKRVIRPPSNQGSREGHLGIVADFTAHTPIGKDLMKC